MRENRAGPGADAVFLTGTAAVSQLLGFCYRVSLARLVGAQVMGLYQLVMSAYSVLMSLTAVGLTACMSNLTARYLAMGNGRAVEQTRRSCLILLALAGGAVSLLTAAFSDFISVRLLGDARTQLPVLVLLPCVLLTGVENIHKHIFYGAGAVRPPAFAELGEQVVRAASVLGLLVLLMPRSPEVTVGLIVTGMTLCEVSSAVTLTLLFRYYFKVERSQGAGEGRVSRLGKIRSIALPIGLTALLSNLMGAADAALIPRKLVESGMDRGAATAQLGVICGMTMPMLSLPTVFLGAVNLVMLPRMAKSYALGRPEQLKRQVCGALSTVSTLILPAMAMMAVLGPDLAQLLFDQRKAGEHLAPLAGAVVLSSIHAVMGSALNAMGKQRRGAAIALLCDGVQLAFTCLIGLPRVGIRGYAAGTLAASALGAGLSIRSVRRSIGTRLPVFEAFTAPTLGALLMGLTGRLLYRRLCTLGLDLLPAMGTVIFFSGVLYLAALQAQGVSFWKNLRLE